MKKDKLMQLSIKQLNKVIVFFLSFILFTGTIAPSITIPINAQNTITCPNTFETFGVEYTLAAGKATATDPENNVVICLYESENAQFSGFPKNPYFTIGWSSIENKRNADSYCHQFQKIYKKSGELQSIYSNEKIAKVSAAKTSGIPLEDVDSFAASLLRQAESLAEQCPYGQSKSSIENTMLIDCPAIFSTKGLVYSLDRAISTIDDPQLMRWGCDYRTHYNDAEEKGLPDNLLFTMRWVEELGPYKYDTGCNSGEEFTFNAVPQVWSKEFHVFAAGPAYAESIPTSDINSVLVTLLAQAETFAIDCVLAEIEELNVQPEFEISSPLYWCEELTSDSTIKILPGKVVTTSGEVFVKRVGSPQWTLAYGGMQLKAGDLVRTGPEALARIELVDEKGKIQIDISTDSEFCMREETHEKEEYIIINLFKGAFNALTKGWSNGSIFEVKNADTIVGIRGTDFVITYDPNLDKVTYYLNEGVLDIRETRTGETLTLTAGQILEISNGHIQPASTLTSDIWDSLVEEIGGVFTVIPDWIKNNASWWADDMIEDSDFAQGIQYLISEGIMRIPETAQAETTGDTQGIPSWVKNNAGWWADGQITDDDFVKGIQYLVEQGIIRV